MIGAGMFYEWTDEAPTEAHSGNIEVEWVQDGKLRYSSGYCDERGEWYIVLEDKRVQPRFHRWKHAGPDVPLRIDHVHGWPWASSPGCLRTLLVSKGAEVTKDGGWVLLVPKAMLPHSSEFVITYKFDCCLVYVKP